jgi:hypothetical protein
MTQSMGFLKQEELYEFIIDYKYLLNIPMVPEVGFREQ